MKAKKRKKKKAKAEIVLDKAERTLIRMGLDLIVNRLAGGKFGHYPHAHPLARSNPNAAAVYQNKAYNEGFAAKLISLRSRVSPAGRKEQFQLDTFDLAAAALAVRVTRQKRLWEKASDVDKRRLRKLSDAPEPEIATLLRKLENARRRAKPGTGTSQHQQYKRRHKKWKAFVAWIRYSLLYDEAQQLRIIKRGLGIPGTVRMLAKLRFEALLNAARDVIQERTTAQIPESELLRLVKLARNDLQPSRHRHPDSIVDLERDPEKAKDFMFRFIEKRPWRADGKTCELYPFLKIDFVVQSLRGSYRFEGSNRKQCPSLDHNSAVASITHNAQATGPKMPSQVDAGRQQRIKVEQHAFVQHEPSSNVDAGSKTTLSNSSSLDTRLSERDDRSAVEAGPRNTSLVNRDPELERVPVAVPGTEGEVAREAPLSEISELFNEEEVVSGIVSWLHKQEPEAAYWPQLISRAQGRMMRARGQVFRPYPRSTEGLTVGRLVEECCPGNLYLSGIQKTDFLADWIVDVLTYVYRSPNQVRQVLQKALDVAWEYGLRNP